MAEVLPPAGPAWVLLSPAVPIEPPGDYYASYMCTLTFVPREQDNGYYFAMNRDESISRAAADPPAKFTFGEAVAIYPRDGAGGTWIGANSHGLAFALLNWNDVPQAGAQKIRSRGCVIPALLQFGSSQAVEAALNRTDLKGVLPFRLIGVFPGEKTIREWHWNFATLQSETHPWERRHWFSSSLSDEKAAQQRGALCQTAWAAEDAGSLAWVRRLHGSHEQTPFTICVHRETVRTLSYTEFICTPERIECRYFAGSPCTMKSIDQELPTIATPRAEPGL